jgi:hypothetical protein
MLPEVAILAVCTYVIAFRISPLIEFDNSSERELEDEESQRRLSVGT